MTDKETSNERSSGDGGSSSISEQERDWAQSALAEFNRGSYTSCVQYLTKLESARSHDTKVAHNKAVVEYYKNDLKKTDQFRKNMNVVCAQAHLNIEDLDALEDVEYCVIYYNQAVLLYHLKQYTSALKIMNKVFTFIEPMEESLAHRVCLLLIELHLCTQQPEKALSLIAYIENQFVSTENATKMIGDKDMKPLEKEPTTDKAVSLDAATDAFRLKLLHYRARCNISTCALKACKRELKTILTSNTSGNQNLAAVFLKAHLEYQRGNFNKAISVLNTIPLNVGISTFKETGESPSVMYYNNMGCLHHYMGKPGLANYYFKKAIEENVNAVNSFPKPDPGEGLSGRPLYTVGGSKSPQLMYNFGVSLLHAGKPLHAFDCLTEAVQVYHMNPQLWLRLAECCIMAYKPDNAVDFDYQKKRKELIQGIIGSGPHRKIILNPDIYKNSKYSNEAQSFAIPVASLEFASLCLRNALLLLPVGEATSPLSTPPSPPLDPRQITHLKSTVLAASAYVSLCLGDPVIALEHAKALLNQPNLTSLNKLLGYLYVGEALLLLNRVSEAVDSLNPEQYSDITDGLNKPLKHWYPVNTDTARSVLQYNLAVALTLRGELDKAGQILHQVWQSRSKTECPIQVICLAIYIELLLGHADVARNIIKQNCISSQPR
ncbi:CCR4-NOT transcription complex subunit 10 [Lycorma delicatula]|uniref:CCR4-NOT transcription complex subunit 10 n=1 Tax=Lycorma delicatula TaxID=130591 RepID=UPI003F50F132